jgi:hypothetical protein
VVSRIACIGSRETPADILRWMTLAGAKLVTAGHTIVSGNAPGADQAWAKGGNIINPTKVELCLPWDNFEEHAIADGNVVRPLRIVNAEGYPAAEMELAAQLHPRFGDLTNGAQYLLARNVMIVRDAKYVVGYLSHGKKGGGGTGFAFKIARHFGIKAYDVSKPGIREAFDYVSVNGPIFP